MVECPIVETTLGKVKGRLLHKQSVGKQVYNYTRLPFAKPPVGNLRFEPPSEAEPWNGVLDGSIDPPIPVQDIEQSRTFLKYMVVSKEVGADENNMSEDCLYLSIYTTNPSEKANLPVLFGIYGGGFSIGSESLYIGNVLSGLNDVVVVVPNYRVNIFGFLSMGKDSVCPGNMGLLDQVMALKWTRNNIQAFGGDPNNVTIFGESAGGMAVNYHMYSPLSRGLFHRAVSCSGAIEVPGFPLKTAAPSYEATLKALNIKETDEKDILAHLKTVPADDCLKVVKNLFKKMEFFYAIEDGNFFPEDIPKMIAKGDVAPVPYLLGCNNSEGCGIMNLTFHPNFFKGLSEEECSTSLKGFVGTVCYKGLPDSAYDAVVKEYQKQYEEDESKWSKTFGEAYGDVMFVIPARKSADAHAKSKNPTYMYHMTQQLKYSHDPDYGPASARKVPFCNCDHGDDVPFTLGLPLDEGKLNIDVKFNQEEKDLSREWMKYLTNFAKHGNPNVGTKVQVEWPLYTAEKKEYLSVQQPCSVKTGLCEDRINFWEKEIEPLQNTAQ